MMAESEQLRIEPTAADADQFESIEELANRINLTGYYGGIRLVKATIKKFYDYCVENKIDLPRQNFSIRYRSSIPRQIGLAGSSAIVTATIRALMQFYQVTIPEIVLPNVILSAEKDELGINAGLQDRVVQVFEGCVYMDFNRELMSAQGYGNYERIEVSVLPKLFIAFSPALGKVSGQVLNEVRSKYDLGDKRVISILDEIAGLAEAGKQAILDQNDETLSGLMNRNFDLRKQIMQISDRNQKLIDAARQCGASAKFAGSGGSIVGIYRGTRMLDNLRAAMKRIGAEIIVPELN